MTILATTEAIISLQPSGSVWRFSVTGDCTDANSFAANVKWEGESALTNWSAVSGAMSAATTSVALRDLRAERNDRLAATDWWGVSDRTMSDAETVYRQSLRDLPANSADPANPTWPTSP